MLVGKRKAVSQRRIGQHRVGVQEQDVSSCGLCGGLVVGAAEADVVRILDEVQVGVIRLGETPAQVGETAVGRTVVDDEHLGVDVVRGGPYRVQPLLQVVFYVVADDDDGERHV